MHLLNVQRILVVPHTRCAMASATEAELREQVGESAGQDATWQSFDVVTDQLDPLARTSPRSERTRSSPTASRSAASSTTSTPACSTSQHVLGQAQASKDSTSTS